MVLLRLPVFLLIFQIIQMLREYLNVMGQREAKERLEHISAQLQHTRTKEQVKPSYPIFVLFIFDSTARLQLSNLVFDLLFKIFYIMLSFFSLTCILSGLSFYTPNNNNGI